MTELHCWNCGGTLNDVPLPISRYATCSQCFNELHCCAMCQHNDPSKTMQCFEDRADPPLQKENANFCDFFKPSPKAHNPQSNLKHDAAHDQLNALFGAQNAEHQPDLAQPDTQNAEGESNLSEGDQDATPTDESTLSKAELAQKKLDDLFK